MKLFSIVREFFSALRALISGMWEYLLLRGQKNETAECCHICQALEKPLQLGRYMIRTGPRANSPSFDHPPEFAIYVCNRHHPDIHVDGALWAAETQDFLKKLDVSAHCVYFYHYNRQ